MGEEVGGTYQVVEKSNVDLAEEMASLMGAQRGVEANVTAARTADQMMGTLLDMFG